MINNPDAIRGRSRVGGTIDKKLLNDYAPFFYFNGGAGQRMIISNTTVYQSFTFSTWIKWETGGGADGYSIISKASYYGTAFNDFPVSLILQNNKTIRCALSDDTDWDFELQTESSQTLNEGIWYHIAATYNQTNLIVYIDGESTSSSGTVTIATNTRNWTIGNSAYDNDAGANTQMFKGWILDPRIYNVAKSKSEILRIIKGYDDQTGIVVSYSKTPLP